MMRVRSLAKRVLFGSIPFLRGRFTYYGEIVHFPLGSHIFQRACEEGIYEHQVTNLILGLVEPGTTYFDVGANIGLLSIPVIATCPEVKVVSIEPSPDNLLYLRKTHRSARNSNNWRLVGAAVGSRTGKAEFWSSGGAMGAFDGLKDTGRGGRKHPVQVPLRTLTDIWQEQRRPPVSVIKMDIEGGEYDALKGAEELISYSKPNVVIEWAKNNLAAYGIAPTQLLAWGERMRYTVYAYPSLIPVTTSALLRLAMMQTENFVLMPSTGS